MAKKAKKHRWEERSSGGKCLRCGLTCKSRMRPSKRGPKGAKVFEIVYKTKGGPSTTMPMCTGG